jgi:hypothetical protein
MKTALVTVATITSIASYESMCGAIAECETLAECKDIADKSAALKEYARRINNFDAERRACHIRLIAERRYGELLKELYRTPPHEAASAGGKAKAGKLPPPAPGSGSAYAQALKDTGVSSQAASRYQALAEVPQDVFEAALDDAEGMPTARSVVEAARNPPLRMSPEALQMWGYVRAFDRDGYAQRDRTVMYEAMLPTMQADMRHLVPQIIDFFTDFEGVLQ